VSFRLGRLPAELFFIFIFYIIRLFFNPEIFMRKKWLLFFVLSFYNLTFALPLQDHKLGHASLLQLASALDIPQDADLIAATQAAWLRTPNQERWEMAELAPDKKVFVLNWAKEQGLFAPWKPCAKRYDKALILGATTSRMQMRLDFLIELWNEGVRFSEMVWLTGDRPLDKKVDGLTDRCQSESEAARILWEETCLPEGMGALPVLFIAVPMLEEGSIPGVIEKTGKRCTLRRPNTVDTLLAWVRHSPEPCSALFISDQPFCGYQFAVIKATLPNAILFDLVGAGVDPTSHPAAAAITLDSIARWIYQESLIP
jgi:hypothetical protein